MGSSKVTMKSLSICIAFSLLILLETTCSRAAPGIPSSCRGHIEWAFNTGKNTNPEWYDSMEDKCGVSVGDATFEDFQRLFKCEDIAKNDCNDRGLQYPTTCSVSPCNVCTISPPIPSSCKGHLDWAFETEKARVHLRWFAEECWTVGDGGEHHSWRLCLWRSRVQAVSDVSQLEDFGRQRVNVQHSSLLHHIRHGRVPEVHQEGGRCPVLGGDVRQKERIALRHH